MTLRSAILAAVTGETAQETDPYYNLVSLHLKGDVNTGRSYNAFSDASSNNFRLTNNGDVRGSSFSPYGTSWSNYFSGSSQYLSVADSTAFTLGSGDFTVEAWVYKNSTGRQAIIGQTNSLGANTSASFSLEINASNKVVGGVCSGATGYLATSTADIVLNQWNHIAFVRDGNTLRIYINGVQDGTASVTGITVNDSTNQLAIGRLGEYASLYWIGYISNCRLVKGRCVYPNGTTFNPSTAPLTRTTGGTNPPQGTECSLLTCQSNRFIDNSIANTGGTPFTITVNGSPTVSSFSPFLETDTTSGSGYFDGTGDFLSFANDTALQLSNSTAYTIETWVYLNSLTADGGTAGPLILDCYNQSSPYPGYALGIGVGTVGSGNFEFWDGTAWNVIGPASVNQWLHVAVSYEGSGTTRRFFINGKLQGSASTQPSTINYTSAATFRVGGRSSSNGLNGYISNLRIVKGTAVYTADFTPPTTPLTAAVTNTNFLTLQERGAYNTIGFQDESEYQHVITRPSSANVAQGTFSPFSNSGWSIYTPGSLNKASRIDVAGMSGTFGTNVSYTVEGWFNFTTPSVTDNTCILISNNGDVNYPNRWVMDVNVTSSLINLRIVSESNTVLFSGSTVAYSLGSWVHLAWVNDNAANTFTFYINGQAAGTRAKVSLGSYATLNFFALQYTTGSAVPFYASNFRITNAQALYSNNFTPSAVPFTTTSQGATAGNVALLTFQSNRFADNSSSPKTLTVNGSNSVAAFSPFKPVAYDPQVHGGSGYFDGNGDYLTVADNSALSFGSGDFTFECWVYLTTTSGTRCIYFQNYGNYEIGIFVTSSSTLRAGSYTAGGSANFDFSSSATVAANQWNHVALVRSGSGSNNVVLYLNGVNVASATFTGNVTNGNTSGYVIGRDYGTTYMTGYVSNLRVVKGTAVYTSAFTPPSAPLPLLGNTSLLLNFTNAGVIDSTGKNVLETVGNAGVVTTTIKKYGSGSISLGGNTDYLTAPASGIQQISGDFTLEAWVYPINAGRSADAEKYGTILSGGSVGVSSPEFSWFVRIVSSAITEVFLNINSTTVLQVTGLSISLNAWHHFVVVRSGTSTGNVKFYVDGALIGTSSGASTANLTFLSTQNILTGRNSNSTSYQNWLQGNIDDLRITKGYARYVTGTGANANQMVFAGTNTLALPTKAFPDRGTLSTLTIDMAAPSSVEALVVAGGGAGSGELSGGGGAGGYKVDTNVAVSANTNYTLTIGAGGSGGAAVVAGGAGGAGTSGSLSSISGGVLSTIQADGGGFGAASTFNAGNGGSGGGSRGGTVGTGISGQGNSGGTAVSGIGSTGGGGGATQAGSNGVTGQSGKGGDGISNSITGVPVIYCAGGGGSGYISGGVTTLPGAGGSNGVGGSGGSSSAGGAGTANRGAGGGGGGYLPTPTYYAGGNGGSGVIVIAYPTTFKPLKASLGLVYTIDTVTRPGYRVYKFTAGTGSISW